MSDDGGWPRVAFQGDRGAYSEEAILIHWAGAAVPVPMRENADVAQAVARGQVSLGLLPVENTLAGSVVATYDALADAEVTVVGEVMLPIHHCVLVPPGTTPATLATVESHPVALAQCRRWLAAHPHVEARTAYDTAGAARAVAAAGDRTRGAIAGRAAAAHFGLALLEMDVEDRPDNQTRFLVLARERVALPVGTPARTALVAETDNVPGALLRVLEPLAVAGLNLSKLESRPAGTPWTYRFFLELEHDAGDDGLPRALHTLAGATRSLRVLGTFARAGASAGAATATGGAHG